MTSHCDNYFPPGFWTIQLNPTNDQITVRLLVGTKNAGGLIGKGGSIIQSFRESTGAWIDVADIIHGAPKRIVTVKGSIGKVKQALQHIADRYVYLCFLS